MKFLSASQRQQQPLEENPVTRKDKKVVGILSFLDEEGLVDDE